MFNNTRAHTHTNKPDKSPSEKITQKSESLAVPFNEKKNIRLNVSNGFIGRNVCLMYVYAINYSRHNICVSLL